MKKIAEFIELDESTELISLDETTRQNVETWLYRGFDPESKEIILKLLRDNPQEIVDSFYKHLTFGTGGLRGIMGVGTNRMNLYTVRAATQALANTLLSLAEAKAPEDLSVFIGYDSRHNSREFAEEAAKVLAANEIKAYLCVDVRPTPYISFGCRKFQCGAAIMITASHNPPQYNGYKVYWYDGGQVLPPHDQAILEEIKKINDPSRVKTSVKGLQDPLIQHVGQDLDRAYIEYLKDLQLCPERNLSEGKRLHVVYTSLHGTGSTLMSQALEDQGFTNVSYVREQMIPDGDFPTVDSPNPEERGALDMGVKLLKEKGADILIATDPDADRLGAAVYHRGEIHYLSGNQIAVLCLEYICQSLNSAGRLPEKAGFLKTFVTTELFSEIAKSYGKTCIDVLPGFKYIAQKINEWEREPNGPIFIFGGEESFGYLLGTQTRDKDGISAAALICEVALYTKLQGKTLVDSLTDLYRKYGYYYETVHALKFPETKEGKTRMQVGMEKFFANPPRSFCNTSVLAIDDFRSGKKMDLINQKSTILTQPKSSMLVFWLESGEKLVLRPSGTEPKIKIYCSTFEKLFDSLKSAQQKCEKRAKVLIQELEGLFLEG